MPANHDVAAIAAGLTEALSSYRPPEMTAETVPHWLKELTPEHYAQRRNDEIRKALRSLNTYEDWLSLAASTLHSAGVWSGSEFGSYGHSCMIIADALVSTRDAIKDAVAKLVDTLDGAVIVPDQPTDEMLDAAEGVSIDAYCNRETFANHDEARAIWRAMIEASRHHLQTGGEG